MTINNKPLENDKRILVVDDDDLVRASMVDALLSAGFEVLEAGDGRTCIDILHRESVDAVVLDIIMPEMEGLEVITSLRKTHPHVKILAVSGGGRTRNTDILKAADKLGADEVLYKPFDPERLVDVVRGLAGLTPRSDSLGLFPMKGASSP